MIISIYDILYIYKYTIFGITYIDIIHTILNMILDPYVIIMII